MNRIDTPIRVLALIYPIERHVGHWASSSSQIEIRRIIMDAPQIEEEIENAIRQFQPKIIAICGKAAIEYLNLLDEFSVRLPIIKQIPIVFRMQNSSLLQQTDRAAESKELCQELSLWFRLASDPRWSWIFVQTLNDVEIVRDHLSPVPVSPCPYGYDTAVFDPDLPELERDIDVGFYMNIRDDQGRKELLHRAKAICHRKGWSFRFVEGVYWHDYAKQIRRSKIALHRSIHREIPFRMYETTVFGTLFVTDPLETNVEELFTEDKEYVTYKPDLSNLEEVMEKALTDDQYRLSISKNGRLRARQYSWDRIADKYVAPALKTLLNNNLKHNMFRSGFKTFNRV